MRTDDKRLSIGINISIGGGMGVNPPKTLQVQGMRVHIEAAYLLHSALLSSYSKDVDLLTPSPDNSVHSTVDLHSINGYRHTRPLSS